MILEFMTRRNTYGHRRYLAIDTGAEIYTRECPHYIPQGVEITTRDYNSIINMLKRFEFTERDRIF